MVRSHFAGDVKCKKAVSKGWCKENRIIDHPYMTSAVYCGCKA